MTKIRIPRAVCAVIGEVLSGTGSHPTIDALFLSAGAPGPPPDLPHSSKWKTWLFQAGNDTNVDGLAVLGNILEEFMDVAPSDETDAFVNWVEKRERVVNVLEEYGFRYYRGGRILPNGDSPAEEDSLPVLSGTKTTDKPSSIEELLFVLLPGLRRAMHPLTHRRKALTRWSLIQSMTYKICFIPCCALGYLIFDRKSSRPAMLAQAREWISCYRPTHWL